MTEPTYPMQEGIRGRDGGPYLDEIEAMREEERRAYLEGRPVNYDNISNRTTGNVPASQLVDNSYTSNPGSRDREPFKRFDVIAKDGEQYTVTHIPGVDTGLVPAQGDSPVAEKKAASSKASTTGK